jgi:eukaryotic-like serine/threonine-protein kinase
MLHKDEQIGEYRLEKFLGRGQFGEVWLAEKQLQFSSKKIRHALKFLFNTAGSEIDLRNAQAEIDTWIEAGGHPNVINVLDMLVYQGHVVIVSEYADGGDLKDWLRHYGGKAPSEEKAVELMFGILRGIEHLHSRNVVHRDLKPQNILLQGDFPRITDFGISRIVAEGGSTTTQAFGSPAYMSPEAFSGSKAPQADIWSAGIILYEMLSGELPFEGEGLLQLIKSIAEDEPKPPPHYVSRELREIVLAALQKDREKRIQSAREMRLALETATYNLRKRSADATLPYSESEIETLPTKNETDKTHPLQTQPAPTQDAVNLKKIIEPVKTQDVKKQNTGEQKTESTTSRNPIESAENLDYQAELLKINLPQAERKKSASAAKYWIAALLGCVLIGLSIGAFLAWRSGGSTTADKDQTNSNGNPVKNPEPPAGMAYIPGGEFTMGRDDGKSEAEKPAHQVSVKPFFMDLTEVTNEQYAEFIKAANYRPPTEWKNCAFPNGQAKFPVVGVDWEDAAAFCKNAGKRLPTEEEWEFAARGKGNFLYPWGNQWQPGLANAGGAGKTFSEVGKFRGKSPFGLYDMTGNAWEWTASDFKEYPNGKLPEAFAGKNNLKTIRGGSFEATKDFATSTYRIGWAATGADNYSRTGFRCVKDVEN